MKTVFLFPGQGSQYIGMGKNLYNKLDYAKKKYNDACDILNYDIKEISFFDKKKLLNHTKYTQPAIFIYSIILDYILKDNNITPKGVAGHSLGEISALVSNKCLTFEIALNFIKKRSESMYLEGIENPGKMIAVIDRNRETIENLLENEDEICIANYNSFKQVIISGKKNRIDNFIKAAKDKGIKRIIELKVSGAFHSSLMKNSRIFLEKIIKSINFNNANVPIYQNFSPIKNLESTMIKKNLTKQIDNPVRWDEIILNLSNDNYKHFIEVGPKNVLTKLNKDIIPNLDSKNIERMQQYLYYND